MASILYHGSPTPGIETLDQGSYVTPDEKIAILMGRFHKDTGKTWSDEDLAEPHYLGQEPKWKEGREPMGEPSVYSMQTSDVDLLDNPYEHKLTSPTPVQELIRAKAHSDKRDYRSKHQILQDLLRKSPEEFFVDSNSQGIIGLTHEPSGFRIHMPLRKLVAGFSPHPKSVVAPEPDISNNSVNMTKASFIKLAATAPQFKPVEKNWMGLPQGQDRESWSPADQKAQLPGEIGRAIGAAGGQLGGTIAGFKLGTNLSSKDAIFHHRGSKMVDFMRSTGDPKYSHFTGQMENLLRKAKFKGLAKLFGPTALGAIGGGILGAKGGYHAGMALGSGGTTESTPQIPMDKQAFVKKAYANYLQMGPAGGASPMPQKSSLDTGLGEVFEGVKGVGKGLLERAKAPSVNGAMFLGGSPGAMYGQTLKTSAPAPEPAPAPKIMAQAPTVARPKPVAKVAPKAPPKAIPVAQPVKAKPASIGLLGKGNDKHKTPGMPKANVAPMKKSIRSGKGFGKSANLGTTLATVGENALAAVKKPGLLSGVKDHFKANAGSYARGAGTAALGYGLGHHGGYNQGYSGGQQAGYDFGQNVGKQVGFGLAQSQAQGTGFFNRLRGDYDFDPSKLNGAGPGTPPTDIFKQQAAQDPNRLGFVRSLIG